MCYRSELKRNNNTLCNIFLLCVCVCVCVCVCNKGYVILFNLFGITSVKLFIPKTCTISVRSKYILVGVGVRGYQGPVMKHLGRYGKTCNGWTHSVSWIIQHKKYVLYFFHKICCFLLSFSFCFFGGSGLP